MGRLEALRIDEIRKWVLLYTLNLHNLFYGRMRNLVVADFHVMQSKLSYSPQLPRVNFTLLSNAFPFCPSFLEYQCMMKDTFVCSFI